MKHIKQYREFITEKASQSKEITEMGRNDWRVQSILDAWKGGSKEEKETIAKKVADNPKADANDIIKSLAEVGKEEIEELATELGLSEKIAYPDGVKTTGDKILDKFAKLINSPSSTVNIMSWAVQGRSIPFMTGSESFAVNSNPSQDYFWINTSKGKFRLPKNSIKKAEELYSEVESIVQTGKPKLSVEESLNEKKSRKVTKQIWDKLDDESRLDALMSIIKDPDEAEKYVDRDWNNLPDGANFMLLWESAKIGKIVELLKKENIMAYPLPEDLAKAIHKHYEEITGNKYEDPVEMSMNDTIAELVNYYKVDGSTFMSAWDRVIK